MSTHPALRLGLFAGGFNAGMLVVNMGFSQAQAVAAPNPGMFSPFGQVLVLVWGLAAAAWCVAGGGTPCS